MSYEACINFEYIDVIVEYDADIEYPEPATLEYPGCAGGIEITSDVVISAIDGDDEFEDGSFGPTLVGLILSGDDLEQITEELETEVWRVAENDAEDAAVSAYESRMDAASDAHMNRYGY